MTGKVFLANNKEMGSFFVEIEESWRLSNRQPSNRNLVHLFQKSAKALEKLNVRWIVKLTVHLCRLQALQTKRKTISVMKTISYRRQMRQITQQVILSFNFTLLK